MQLRGIDAALRFTTKVCFLAVLLHLRCLGQVTEIAPRRSSLSEGVEVIAKVAELGDPVSQRYLGVAYLFGKGVMQDFSQAVFWFSKASLQGDQPAQNELADCFEFGRGVKRNLPIALGIRRKLANEGYGHAQMLLGLSYFMDGIRLDWPTGIQTNYVQAYKWMSLAAAQEYPGAEQQRNEFVAEMNSQSVAFAQRLAREFVLKPASPLLLNGVTTNISSAPLSKAKEDADKKAAEARLVSWQHIQATNGADFAQYALGVRYLKGDGVSTNRSVARHWLKSASTNEHQAAIKLLREMSSDGK